MQAFPREETYSKTLAMERLTQIAYPNSGSVMSRKTFWRMAKTAETPLKLKEFTFEQMARLARVANYRRQGYGYEQIKELLGTKNNDNHNSRSQRQGVRPESGQNSTATEDFFSSYFSSRG